MHERSNHLQISFYCSIHIMQYVKFMQKAQIVIVIEAWSESLAIHSHLTFTYI